MREKCKECMVGYWLPAPSPVGLTYESGCHSPAPTARLRRFNYCPDCGRELGEKAEASVEERVETLSELTLRWHGEHEAHGHQGQLERLAALETGRAGQKSGCPSRIQLWGRIQALEERKESHRHRLGELEKWREQLDSGCREALERRNAAPTGD